VFGHAENGVFKFVDGSSLPIAELSKAARSPIVFLGCNTLTHVRVQTGVVHVANMVIATGRRIDYPEATEMIRALQRLVSEGSRKKSLRTLLLRLQSDALLKVLIGVTEVEPWQVPPRGLNVFI
jgi:hypothetical protein